MKLMLTASKRISSENKKKNTFGFKSAIAIAKKKKPKDSIRNIGII